MIKLLLLADVNSPHTIKWATNLVKHNYKITIFTLSEIETKLFDNFTDIKVISHHFNSSTFLSNSGSFKKIKYLTVLSKLKNVINDFKPDIVHAHFASSYGLLGALTGFKNFVISLWGQDIMLFPTHSPIHKAIFKFNLSRAKVITATSKSMAEKLKDYSTKKAFIIPFGIDIDFFNILSTERPYNGSLVIGTVKNLEEKYGIDLLIKAFKEVKSINNGKDLKLLIVGKGSKEEELKKLSFELGIADDISFNGYVNPDEINKFHNYMDIEVYLSRAESFGVSIIEASSCRKPVIVSNVGGLPEVVVNNETGFIVESEDYKSAAEKINSLIVNAELRKEMGNSGREFVINNYNFESNLKEMINLYKSILQ
ncbi:MAG: glycosyltransferase [Melioribacteraceae bacterium]|nr:glycosyl transferase family 1 [Ignavibacteriota bacterium]MBZ0183788.1 glycosyltransferase [Melioribacteraceae bacterium]